MNTIPTRKQLRHNLARYILPSIGAMIFFSLYTMVDGMFVGKGVGPQALASVKPFNALHQYDFRICLNDCGRCINPHHLLLR